MTVVPAHSTSRLRIIVEGYIVRLALGGMAWHYLNYVLGLSRLGHDVYYLEDSGDSEWACYNPTTHETTADPEYGLAFAARTFSRAGLDDRWAYHDALKAEWRGPAGGRMHEICSSADLLIRMSHVNPMRPWLEHIPLRVLMDVDPVFTQMWHLNEPAIHEDARHYNRFFSFAENVRPGSGLLPDDGFDWRPTRQPVVLDAWPVTPGPVDGRFTTVMQWDSYTTRIYNGQHYGMKSESFPPYLDMPSAIGPVFELAMGSPNAPREELAARGWIISDPLAVTRDPWTYQNYIQQSKGEFTIAKHGYVSSWSGWFSERSAVYLASGRPVIVQDTGFSEWMKSDAGLLPFNTHDQAVHAVEDVNSRYRLHCEAARDVATTFFDSNKVLTRLIEDVYAESSPHR